MFAKSFEMVLFGLTKISSSCRPRDGDRTALRFPLGFLTNHAGLDQSKAPHPNAATSSAASPGGSASDLRCVRYFFFWSKRCVRYFVCVLTAACAVGASRDHVTAIAGRLRACYAVLRNALVEKKGLYQKLTIGLEPGSEDYNLHLIICTGRFFIDGAEPFCKFPSILCN